MERLGAIIAFAFLAAFVGILAVKVPSPDLVAVVVLTVCLVAYDFFIYSRKKNKN